MEKNKEKSKCCGAKRIRATYNDKSFEDVCQLCKMPFEPQVDKQQEECEHLNVRCPVICNDCGITLKNAPLTYPVKQEYKQQEVREEFINIPFGDFNSPSYNISKEKIADWWLNKLFQAIEQELKEIRDKVSEIEETRQISKVLNILDNHIKSNINK